MELRKQYDKDLECGMGLIRDLLFYILRSRFEVFSHSCNFFSHTLYLIVHEIGQGG